MNESFIASLPITAAPAAAICMLRIVRMAQLALGLRAQLTFAGLWCQSRADVSHAG